MRRSVLTLLLLAFGLMSTASTASAEAVNQAFAGRIMVSEKRFPMTASSLAAFNAQVTKQSVSVFKEDKDKKYLIYFAGFLKAPLNDVEYMVKLYELQPKGQKLLASFEQFSDQRGQASLLSKMQLDKKTVGTNKEVLMTIESKGKVIASGRFKLIGEGEKYNGKVNFSEDEANGKKTDDDD
jgi:hypothetical protein